MHCYQKQGVYQEVSKTKKHLTKTTKQSMTTFHTQRQLNQESYTSKDITELMDAFGGIEQIFNLLLSPSNDIHFIQNKLQKIGEILTYHNRTRTIQTDPNYTQYWRLNLVNKHIISF